MQDGDWARYGCWPQPLGAIPCGPGNLPVVALRSTAAGVQLAALGSAAAPGAQGGSGQTDVWCEDYVHCSTLA